MKHLFVLWITLSAWTCLGQWPEFNQVHPVSCQWPAYNYMAHGSFENVFVVDISPSFYDGYLTFGRGILCHPDSCINETRNFSAKCNENGDLMWWNRYDNHGLDLNETWFNTAPGNRGGMFQNHKGELVSTFSTREETGEIDTFRDYLLTLDMFGHIVGQHLIDSSLAAYSFFGLIEDLSDSTYVAHGWYMDSLDVVNNIEPDVFLLKMDSLGNHIWQKEYAGTFGSHDVVKAMDGGFWLCATTPGFEDCSDGFFQNNDFVLIKTDEFGNEEDRITFGGSCSNEAGTVHEYEEDKVVLVGRLTNEENGLGDSFRGYYYSSLIEQQSNGNLIETTEPKQYLSTYNGHFVDLHYLPNQGYLIVSDSQLLPEQGSGGELVGRWKGCLMALDMNRDSLWMRSYAYYNNGLDGDDPNVVGEHHLLDSKPTPDGGWVCAGYVWQLYADPNPLLYTPWLFKVDSLGCLEPGCQDVGVSEMVIGLQNTMNLFPNPVGSVANIAFSFPADFAPPKNSELVVVDMQGREVFRQTLALYGQTKATIEMEVSTLSAGMYTVHWVSGGAWLDSVKMVKE
jgi:Secretion system C-terminal sorting domain